MNVLHVLQDRIQNALVGLVPDPAPYAAQVKATADARHGDYQANCAMALAKVLGKPPRAIAQMVVDRLQLNDIVDMPEIAGPGFINLRLKNDWLAAQVQAMARDERLGVTAAAPARTYVIDYSSPNVAKPMHVGHLRSTIIGDSLTRLLRFLGHRVITDNHLGDWGSQFGILLHGYKTMCDEAAFQANPVRELARLYVGVRRQFKKMDDDAEDTSDPVQEACRRETAKLHAGDPENVRLWEMFMPFCYEEIERIYKRLGILPFDHTFGESYYNAMLPAVVADLQANGIAEESQGALVIYLDPEKTQPPAMIRKGDGAFTYTTTDLATIRYRVEQWHPDAILYVVDFRQALHFKSLFEVARRWGYDNVALEHVSHGSVLGDDRKPLKTREGSAASLEGLLDEAEAHACRVALSNQEQEETTRPVAARHDLQHVGRIVGIGAIKYADLAQNRTSDYVYSLEKMTLLNGNTATYMQYAFARNRSIFRKGGVDMNALRAAPPLPTLEQTDERALALQLVRFEDALAAAAADYRPSQITTYLWELAKTYSGFFQNCPVLKAETPELRSSRLLLCDLTARVIQRGLELLGIETLERM